VAAADRPSGGEQICPACDGSLHAMGKETVRRELKLIPAGAVIVEHVQYTYACRNCERNAISVPIWGFDGYGNILHPLRITGQHHKSP
jgi:hypothetical protein